MKKLCRVFVLFLVALMLCACQAKKNLSEYQGTWLLADSDYYLIGPDKVSRITKDAIRNLYTQKVEEVVLGEGEEAFWALTIQDIPLDALVETLSETTQIHALELDVGVITAEEEELRICHEEVFYSFSKISDDTALAGQWLESLLAQCKQGVVVQMDKLLPTPEQYSQFLRQKNTKIDSWKEVKRDDGANMVSDTGKEKKHKGALTVTDTSVLYSKGSTTSGVGSFSVEYGENQIKIVHKNFGVLQDIVGYAEPVLEALPYNINVQQLLALYQSQRTCKDNQFLFQYAEGGMEFTITRGITGKKTELIITVPQEMEVPVAPVERTEPPYTTGFHTEEVAKLSNEKVYYISYKFEDITVENRLYFAPDGRFYMTAYFEYGFEPFFDTVRGTYEVEGDQITLYTESVKIFGEKVKNPEIYTMVYQYDAENGKLKQIGDRGLSWKHKKGQKHTLKVSKTKVEDILKHF